jgi:hypothetical protein
LLLRRKKKKVCGLVVREVKSGKVKELGVREEEKVV